MQKQGQQQQQEDDGDVHMMGDDYEIDMVSPIDLMFVSLFVNDHLISLFLFSIFSLKKNVLTQAQLEEEDEEEDQDSKMLVRSRKRAKRDD